MRIAFISCEFPPDTGKGGIGTYTEQIATSLAILGWDVHVFSGSQKRECIEERNGVIVHWVKYGSPNDFHLNVVRFFEREYSLKSFDLMECAEIQGNGWEIKKAFPQLPLVVRLHAPTYLLDGLKNSYISFFSKLRFVLGSMRRMKFDLGYWRAYDKTKDEDYKFTLLADYITAPSEAMKLWAVKHWELPEKFVTVIPNIFIPPSELLSIPIVKDYVYKRIVFFGRLNPLKGLVNCCKGIKNLLVHNPEWKFRIIGDDGPGPFKYNSMKAWIEEYLKAVIGQVEFINGLPHNELPMAIAESEIVILPSLFESFSYTCIEAMAAGKAVVGSNSGGMKDLLEDQHSGFLIDPNSSIEIRQALKKLMKDNSLRYKISVNARNRVTNELNSTSVIKTYTSYYQNILSQKSAAKQW